MALIPQKHYIQPGDAEKQVSLPLSVAELKVLQTLITQRIERDAAEKNEACKTHQDLATKLEYYITDNQ